MSESPIRIDGWKAIAAHFRRDRSTVIRWAAQSDFPLRRGPGEKGASVWAYAHELDAWLAGVGGGGAGRQPARAPRAPLMIASLLVGVARVSIAVYLVGRATSPTHAPRTLPADPAVAELYMQARDDWAARTPEGLKKALAELGEVTSRDPGFAPAYAGIADVYMLMREYGGLPETQAFPKAEAAARLGLALDPGSAQANRAQGFIDYRWRHDIAAARAHFEKSLRREPNNAQTHFWFGNVLLDDGDDTPGLAELRTARELDPGSAVIETAYAVQLWAIDTSAEAASRLQDLAARDPQSSDAQIYLSWVYLVKGDVAAYLDQREKFAALVRDPALTRRVADERSAFNHGGPSAALSFMANAPPANGDAYSIQNEWPASAAAMVGARARLLTLIAQAQATHERWTTWRAGQPRFDRWRRDRTVMEGLARLRAVPPKAS